jgi:hypothetical protein
MIQGRKYSSRPKEDVEMEDIKETLVEITNSRDGIPDIHLSVDDVPVFSSLAMELDASRLRKLSKSAPSDVPARDSPSATMPDNVPRFELKEIAETLGSMTHERC